MDADPRREGTPTDNSNGQNLVMMLQAMQARHGYLPEEALRQLARETGRSLVDIYAVATFYKSFSLKPRGRHVVLVCAGTACHVRGAPTVRSECERHLGIVAGETTADGEFTLEVVNCLGACALGPIVVIDGRYHPNVSPSEVGAMLTKVRAGQAHGDEVPDGQALPVEAASADAHG